jgi:putative flippase GtrA
MTGEMILMKFLKYCVVGFSGMAIDFGTTWLLKERIKVNKYIANSAGFIFAASSNYTLNRLWTFHSVNPGIAGEYALFVLISIVGLVINNLVIFLLNEKMKFNFYLSKLFAIGVVTLWNFFMNYLYTFS